ncbi:UNVERIFIED_CONTAM: hypothetical protein H355_000908 [Colinus virginianus]|nr:hypothetical protein H355_000908 [Colinus virginianus]
MSATMGKDVTVVPADPHGTDSLQLHILMPRTVSQQAELSTEYKSSQRPASGNITESSSEFFCNHSYISLSDMCIATAISLLMILICAMATYGAYKQHAAWIIPFFCYQIFDFALNTLVAISVLVYPSTIQDYLHQLPSNFPYKEEIMSVNPTCLVVIILLFISIILAFKGYLISCVWNCYRYINGRNNSEVLVYITTNDTAVRMLDHREKLCLILCLIS